MPHWILWLRPSDTLNTAMRKICFTTGKGSSVKGSSPRDMQSKVMEQKLALLERYCGSCHVCLESTLSTLAITVDSPSVLFWTEICWKHTRRFPETGTFRVDEFQNVTFVASFKLTLEIKCYTEPRFYCEVGKVKGRRERPGEPCLRANYLSSCRGDERHGSVCSVHHAHKSSLSTRFKCARMHGNTNTSSTYNRRSIIASWL